MNVHMGNLGNSLNAMKNKKLSEYFNYRKLSKQELQSYEDNGYLVIDKILTNQGIDLMVEQCMKAWSKEKEDFDPGKNWLHNALLPNIHHRSELVRDFYFHGPLIDIAEQLIGPNIKGVTSQLTFKMRGNTKPFSWHQDNGYGELEPYNSITCLTSIDIVSQTSGCLWIIPGSHKQGQLQPGLTIEEVNLHREVINQPDESKSIPMPMQPGQCLIFNCWMLHKSDGNYSTDRDRRILFLRYADADAIEVYNERKPRLGRLVRGKTRFPEVEAYEAKM